MSGTLLPWIKPLWQLLLPSCWLVEALPISFSSFDIGLWDVKIRALSLDLYLYWCMEVLMWARADRCEYFKIQLTVLFMSLFILCLKRVCPVWIVGKGNCKKGGIFLSFPVSENVSDVKNVSSWYFHRYVKDTYFSRCDIYRIGLCVHRRNDRKTSCPWRKLSRSISEDSNKLYLSSYSWQWGSDTLEGRNS